MSIVSLLRQWGHIQGHQVHDRWMPAQHNLQFHDTYLRAIGECSLCMVLAELRGQQRILHELRGSRNRPPKASADASTADIKRHVQPAEHLASKPGRPKQLHDNREHEPSLPKSWIRCPIWKRHERIESSNPGRLRRAHSLWPDVQTRQYHC